MTSSVYIPAQQGRKGQFEKWLHDLGLESFIRQYPIDKLVNWGWITPVARKIFPRDFFDEWKHFPNLPHRSSDDQLAALWSPSWRIDEISSSEWCIYPFSVSHEELGLTVSSYDTKHTPEKISHKRGFTISPYCDYFYHWQAYALIDTIAWADNGPMIRTPDLPDQLRALSEHTFIDAKKISYSTSRWGEARSKHFTWISHYRSSMSAVDQYIQINNPTDKRLLYKKAAADIAIFLNISTSDIEDALKQSLLTVAQEWSPHTNGVQSSWCRGAWLELQRDVHHCVEWLCLLSDKSADDYLEKLSYQHLGQLEWAQLHDVLDFEYFQNLIFFSKRAPQYISLSSTSLSTLISEDPVKLRQQARSIAERCPPFWSFIASFKAIHDDLNASNDQSRLDLRHRRPLDHFATLAIRAETCLRYALFEANDSPPEEKTCNSLYGYIRELICRASSSESLLKAFTNRDLKNRTELRDNRHERITSISGITFPELGTMDQEIVRYYLGCLISRNYFAHHYDQDNHVTRGKSGEFLIASTTFTVWHLLTKYFKVP